jgi:hypothetical protein
LIVLVPVAAIDILPRLKAKDSYCAMHERPHS